MTWHGTPEHRRTSFPCQCGKNVGEIFTGTVNGLTWHWCSNCTPFRGTPKHPIYQPAGRRRFPKD